MICPKCKNPNIQVQGKDGSFVGIQIGDFRLGADVNLKRYKCSKCSYSWREN